LNRLLVYPRLHASTRRIRAVPKVAGAVRLGHVERHSWDGHETIDRRIVPIGPRVEFDETVVAQAA
jgi:glutathionyl-hydroquinone reductase